MFSAVLAEDRFGMLLSEDESLPTFILQSFKTEKVERGFKQLLSISGKPGSANCLGKPCGLDSLLSSPPLEQLRLQA